MKNEKYEITGIEHPIHKGLFRIKALKGFGGVEKGELGGFIESEANLSVSGKAWVSGEAQVFGKARVSGEAQVSGEAWVFGEAWVSGEAQVFGEAQVSGKAWVSGEAQVFGEAQVSGKAWVSGEAQVFGKARVFGEAWVSGEARVFGEAIIALDFEINYTHEYVNIGPIGSRGAYLTITSKYAFTGCFAGTHAELIEKSGDREWTEHYELALEFGKKLLYARGVKP